MAARVKQVDRRAWLELFRQKFEASGGYSSDSAINRYRELVSQQRILEDSAATRTLPLLAKTAVVVTQTQLMFGLLMFSGFLGIATYGALDGWYLSPFFVMIVLALLPTSIGLIIYGSIRASRSLNLAKQGQLAWAVITEIKYDHPAGVASFGARRSNRDGNWRVSYAYAADGRMHFGVEEMIIEPSLNETFELVLFDRNEPELSQLADSIDGGCKFKPDGTLEFSVKAGFVSLALVIGAIPAGILVGWAMFTYGS